MSSLFEKKIETLYGVGAKRAELFHRLGIETVGELVRFYPRSYEDYTSPVDIAEVTVGESCCIKATLESPVVTQRISKGRLLSRGRVFDETGFMTVTFFNNRYVGDMLKSGREYTFYGKVTRSKGNLEMLSPMFSDTQTGNKIRPIYHTTAGLTTGNIENAVKQAIRLLPNEVKEPIPQFILNKYSLEPLDFAIRKIHFPDSTEQLKRARKRLVFEELFILSLGLRRLKTSKREETSIDIKTDYSAEFFSLLPFEPTSAQLRASRECIDDMINSKTPMNRLLQGDVGSGKTAVAAAVCYTVIKNGWQAAFMAPTEILAQQHFSSLTKLLEGTGVRTELLIGSVTAAGKRKIRERLKNGEIDLLIGTNAIISDGVEFKALGIAVTDEQHRFGVRQRARLTSMGNKPHTLVMSATPIPRTLGLIIYGDLDISLLDELPPGRQKISTFLINSKKRAGMYGFIKDYLDKGLQAYIVCPSVEENELNIASATEYYEKISAGEFKNYSVGLLHGKMKPKEKDAVMHSFLAGDIQLLVSTTVIEVGVDVPNSVIMAIENAERFGFSQLHQLRGRVGRGSEKSYCFLLSDAQGEDTLQRLKTMCRTNNGFEIADMDLKLRGPGDFFGARQHGLPEMHIADLADMDSLKAAQQAADDVERKFPDLQSDECRGLRAEIKRLFSRVGAEGMN
ncbi:MULTISPECIES: ATP-dependent DNA helicase RecG [unclassified Ruminococcus]|uniref:ATP-dependent DNA helicase RecG n=1 Tax=unclassified Ruminococcus TaxID=2608920 RepID=UPI00210E943A|nr:MULTISPECIES: ATP-dependent DNA helicase RecG [unclassified Ruminococcus]MCQ4023338.1 ATP-dependent DNA helicase RecG [Ruminococcus sp. zg-924]MCQ4115383.1 ATP-dependent DNA helicase RecG [Ruminococcus sp. zg-921]